MARNCTCEVNQFDEALVKEVVTNEAGGNVTLLTKC